MQTNADKKDPRIILLSSFTYLDSPQVAFITGECLYTFVIGLIHKHLMIPLLLKNRRGRIRIDFVISRWVCRIRKTLVKPVDNYELVLAEKAFHPSTILNHSQ